MSRRHNRRRKEERRARITRDHESLFATRPGGEQEAPPSEAPGKRRFTLFVKGGWGMDFDASGIRVPFDAEAVEAPPLKEMTLGEILQTDDESES